MCLMYGCSIQALCLYAATNAESMQHTTTIDYCKGFIIIPKRSDYFEINNKLVKQV